MRQGRCLFDPRGYVVAAGCVAGATAVFCLGREDFAKGQWALLYLLIVGVVAGLRGVGPALLAAVLSFLCWNFFLLPPYGTFHLADPRDWLFLFIFLGVAVVLGLQTGRLRDREAQAKLRALAAQADALREADRLKSTFVSAVSHELKTPLASLEATVSNLLEQDAPLGQEQIREELAAVKLDLDQLSESIESLLDLSRLEASAWGPRLDWYEFGEVVGTTLSRLSEQERKRVELAIPQDLPPIRVDFSQWVRVLEHLLRNALAYGDSGAPVRVGASATAEEFRVWVEDAGPGIEPDERALVFEKFYRGRAAAKAPAGTGLGLAISREIVRFHGGAIWVEDASPRGARFVITVPRTAMEEELPHGRATEAHHGPGD